MDFFIFYSNTKAMIRKYIIKLTAIFTTLFLFSLTAADMYIKTVGDASGYPAYQEVAELTKTITAMHPKKNNLRIMTYNLLADSVGFEGSNAKERSNGVCNILNNLSPDVAALQEVSRRWYALITNNTNYKFIHPVRTGLLGTMTALVYNPQTLLLIYSGEKSFKSGNSSPLRRMVWAVFKFKETGDMFVAISTHLSLSTEKGSAASVALMQALELTELTKEINSALNCPIIVAGDFNAPESTEKTSSPVYDVLSAYFYDSKKSSQNESSLSVKNTANIKDHIFSTNNITSEFYCLLSHKAFEALSDHYPVFTDFSFATI